MKKWNIGAAAVFFAISAFVFVSTAEYAHPIGANTIGQDPGSAIWPRCLAVLLAVLSIGMVIEGFVSKAYRDNNEAPINLKAPERALSARPTATAMRPPSTSRVPK